MKAAPNTVSEHPGSVSALVPTVRNVLDQLPNRTLPTLLVAVFPLEPSEVHGILSLQGVAGCVANLGAGIDRIEDCGCIDPAGGWEFPEVKARSVTYLGWSRSIRPRRLFEAMQRGLPWVVAMDTYGRWRASQIPIWYASYLVTRMRQSKTAGTLARLDLPLSLPESEWIRRARKALVGLRDEPRSGKINDRVLLVTGSLGAGGAERQVIMTALSLARAGKHVELLSIYTGKSEFDFFLQKLENRVRVWSLTDVLPVLFRKQNPFFGSFLENVKNGRSGAILKLLPRPLVDDVVALAMSFVMLRPDVIHLWQDHTNLAGGIAGLMAQVPRIVMSGRSAAPYHFAHHRRYMQRVYRLLLGFREVVLLNNSESGAKSYADWLDVPASDITVVHNGIDTSAFATSCARKSALREEWLIPKDAPLIGAVFRFSPEKDPMLWLETAVHVARRIPSAHFVMIGEGELLPLVRTRVHELGLAGRVCLPGLVDDMPAAFRAMDVLLLTSVIEGLPNVLIEAQLAGCPVITTDAGGCRETVRHGDTGWIVGERSAEALSERICEVLNNDAWRARVMELGPHHIARAFGLERMLAETLEAYGLEPLA